MEHTQLTTQQLNPAQERAVTAPLGPTLIIAGPGSGKTFVITQRIHYMIHALQCHAHQILVITFTKAAAEEMKSRYHNLFGINSVQFGTFHSIFYRILRMADANRYDLSHLLAEDQKKKIIEKLYRDIGEDLYEDFIELFLSHLTLMKNQLIQPQYYNPDGLSKELFTKVYQAYENYKERHQYFDFDDMLVNCYYELKHNPSLLKHLQNKFHHILIDEFQDINCVQFETIKMLASTRKDLFVVGDDDQSIYQFRGAKPEFLLSFEEYFNPVNKIILNINYRSSASILSYSNALIAHNTVRYDKEMLTANGEGILPQIIFCEDAKDTAKHILQKITEYRKNGEKLSECAIIYRTNIQARPFIETFMSAHLPFVLRDQILTLYDQWITKDILAYLHLAQDINQPEYILQVLNRPMRYISKKHLQECVQKEGSLLNLLLTHPELSSRQKDYIQEFIYHLQCLKRKNLKDAIAYIRQNIGYEKYLMEYASYRKIPITHLHEVLSEIQESAFQFDQLVTWEEHLKLTAQGIKSNVKNQPSDGVILTTMHSAKGLEFKHVFITDIVEGVIPHAKSQDPRQLEEERRLFYVAMTRAKEQLFLFVPKERYQDKVKPSLFLDELFSKPFHVVEGLKVRHKHYGKGIILALHDTKARIQFENQTIRVIDYKYCIENKLLFREEA